MFDIGFWELTIIGVVALLVIGPERLPKVARTVGLWVGRMRGFVMSVKADVDKELRADELKRIMDEQVRSTGLHEIAEETRETFDEIAEETRESFDELNKPDYLVKAMPSEEEKNRSADATGNKPAVQHSAKESPPTKASDTGGPTTKND
ncbi:MAG: Sec-independent protein translocase protein TatB [Gammaproteobacteria bacterium]|nr:Sec-independent protein translocase protein TatB [Gammaproteobacteria bacterium]